MPDLNWSIMIFSINLLTNYLNSQTWHQDPAMPDVFLMWGCCVYHVTLHVPSYKSLAFTHDLSDTLTKIMDTPILLDSELCLLGNITNLKLSQSSLTWKSDSPSLYQMDIRNDHLFALREDYICPKEQLWCIFKDLAAFYWLYSNITICRSSVTCMFCILYATGHMNFPRDK